MIFSNNDGLNFWNKKDVPTMLQDDSLFTNALVGKFFKVGKTFGHKCARQYFLIQQLLLYSDLGNFKDIKGYVKLDSVYANFQQNKNEYLIILKNNGIQIILYTNEQEQYLQWKNSLQEKCILSTFDQDFTLGSIIGNGSFSSVYKCLNHDGETYAVKIISKQSLKQLKKCKYDEQLLSEIGNLRQLKNSNILKLYRVYEGNDKIYLITEYINGHELVSLQRAKKIYNGECLRTFILKMLQVLDTLHNANIIHRDVKPQNIILRNDELSEPCLIDFGLSVDITQIKNDSKKTIPFPCSGSPGYSAPEIIKYEETKKLYNCQCDMFSLGVTLFVILYGYNPFKAQEQKATLKKNADAYFEIPNGVYPSQLENLIQLMTKKFPKDRITCQQAFNHEFFKIPFTTQITLPKTILSKHQYDLMQNDHTVQLHASLEMDYQFGQNNPSNNTTPHQKERTLTINSNPSKQQWHALDQIDEFQLDGLEDTIETPKIEQVKIASNFLKNSQHKQSLNI